MQTEGALVLRRAAEIMRHDLDDRWVPVAEWLESTHANLSTYNATTPNSRHAFAVARRYLGEPE